MRNYFVAVFLSAAFISALAYVSAGQSLSTPNSGSNSGVIPQGATLVVELAKSIDTKKARPGDLVKAKIAQDVISNGQIVIHRGSKLLGHITEAKAFTAEMPESVLGVIFDRVALKHGEELTLSAALVALAPPVPQPDPLGPSNYGGSKGSGSQPVSGRDSGWIVDPRDRRDHTRSDALSNAANPNIYGGASNTLPNGLLGSGNRGVFGMPSVSLRPGAMVSELVSTKADIKLEEGTQMVLKTTW